MYRGSRTCIAVAALSVAAGLTSTASLAMAQSNAHPLESFRSFSELSRYLKHVVDEQNRWAQEGVKAAAEAREAEALSCKPPERTAGGTLRGYWKANDGPGSRSGVVRGRVTNIKGTGVVGAAISAFGLGVATTSRTNGSYQLVIPPESLTTKRPVQLRVSHNEFRDLVDSVELDAGDTATVDLRLCLIWYPPVTVMTGVLPLAYRSDRNDNVAWSDTAISETVKLHGDHLVILQRGRLFTVSIRDHALRPVSVVDSFAPGMEPDSTSYTDLLVSGDKVVVLGFDLKHSICELSTFRIDADGGLKYLATYQMRQDQGVFFPKYTARLVGAKLLIYTPLVVPDDPSKMRKALPAFRKWHTNVTDSEFRTIATPGRVHRPARALSPYDRATLHTVTSCDLVPRELACTATVVIAPAEFEFYSARSAFYVWIGDISNGPTGDEGNTLYRLPFNGNAPSSRIFLNPAGNPFSFMEDDKGYLNVLMMPIWPVGPMPSGTTIYDIGLLRIAVSSFRNDGNRSHAPLYRRLHPGGGGRNAFGFTDDFVLYSNSVSAANPDVAESMLNVMPLSEAGGATVPVAHPIFLIKGLDNEAVAIGPLGNALHFSVIGLADPVNSSKHFAFTDSTDIDFTRQRVIYQPARGETGLLAVPVHNRNRSRPDEGYYNAPSILFLSKTKSGLSFAGRIAARESAVLDDKCKSGCEDWFFDADAFFIGDRIFSLLRYELVESVYENGRIREIGRVSFAPRK
jgi:hypothetical protein